jgi:hypothetical protein
MPLPSSSKRMNASRASRSSSGSARLAAMAAASFALAAAANAAVDLAGGVSVAAIFIINNASWYENSITIGSISTPIDCVICASCGSLRQLTVVELQVELTHQRHIGRCRPPSTLRCGCVTNTSNSSSKHRRRLLRVLVDRVVDANRVR